MNLNESQLKLFAHCTASIKTLPELLSRESGDAFWPTAVSFMPDEDCENVQWCRRYAVSLLKKAIELLESSR